MKKSEKALLIIFISVTSLIIVQLILGYSILLHYKAIERRYFEVLKEIENVVEEQIRGLDMLFLRMFMEKMLWSSSL